jgi:hypothetical protein
MQTLIRIRILWAGISLVYAGCMAATNSPSSAIVAASGSWHHSGLFCFNSLVEETSQLSVVRVSEATPTVLLRTNLEDVVKPPICTSNSVIVVNTSGRVRKFSHSGNLEFDEPVPGVEGVCGLAGRITDGCIYVTETRFSKGRPQYRLHLVDITGTRPRQLAQFPLRRLGPVAQFRGYLFVLGAKDSSQVQVERLRLPKEIGWFN